MKKTILVVIAALAACLHLSAAPDVDAARKVLVEGVAAIDCEGLPGPFVCLADNAFGVVAGRNYDGTLHPVCAAAFAGEGRVVAFGHPGFIFSDAFRFDTERLLKNAFSWLAKGAETPTVGVVKSDAIARMVRALGLEADVVQTLEAAFRHPVVVFYPDAVPVADYPKVHDYIRRGGGLMTAALAWGWKSAAKAHGQTSIALHYDAERLLAPLGLVAGDLGTNRTGPGGKGYATDVAFPYGSTLPEALEALEHDPRLADASIRRQVSKTLLQAAAVHPPNDSPAYARLQALAGDPSLQRPPSVDNPLREEDVLARIAILLSQTAWQADPERLWQADPAASVYPGLPDAKAPRLADESRTFDLSVPRWHSTGLFIGAGEPLTVVLPEEATPLGLAVRVGTTADDITPANFWKRAPLVTVSIPLTKAKTVFSTPFGGLVYLVVPEGLSGTVEAHFSGCVASPRFRLGTDSNAAWAQAVRASAAPQAEIEGRHAIVTMDARVAGLVTDPEGLAKFWDGAVACDAALAGFDAPRPAPERICSDVQLSNGLLHDGYPIMHYRPESGLDDVTDLDRIRKGGCWGPLHELGHNHQNRDWTFSGAGEVTVNLFTLRCLETLLGIDARDAYPGHTDLASCRRRVRRWVDGGRTFEGWKSDPFLALETFTRIKEVFGWNLFLRLFREYRPPVVGALPKNDQERIDQWATRLSRLAGKDFAAYFRAWSWPVTDAAAAECAKYPRPEDPRLWEALGDMPDDAVVALSIAPAPGGGIGNVGNWTTFSATVEAEARQQALVANLRCNRAWRLRATVTDETEGSTRAFDVPIGDMRRDVGRVFKIPVTRLGLVPVARHRYTLSLEVFDGDRKRYAGISGKGAFRVEDESFIDYGPINATPAIKVRADSPLRDFRALFLGDSICEAICEVNVPELNYTAGWAGRIGWANGMRWMNLGRSGATFSHIWGRGNTIEGQLRGLDGHEFDIVVANGGINDGMGGAPCGSPARGGPADYNGEAETFETFAGSLEHFFWTLRRQFPHARLGYIVNYRVPPGSWQDCGTKFAAFIPTAKAVCRKWDVAYIDLWNDERITAQTKPGSRLAFGDSLHANDLGYDIVTPYIEEFVEALWTDAAKPGEEYRANPAPFIDPCASPVGPDDVNVAAGKPSFTPKGGWRNDLTDGSLEGKGRIGTTTRFEDLSVSPCYATVDLGDLYTIDKVRVVAGIMNGVSRFAVFATDDDAKPLSEWTLVFRKDNTRMNTSAGSGGAFTPLDAKYVRFYAYTPRTPGLMGFVEAEVFGRKSERATAETAFFRRDRPLETHRPVPVPAIDPEYGTNLARGARAFWPDGSDYPGATDGIRQYLLRWKGILAGAAKSVDDDAPAYLSVDLGSICEISAVRLVDDDVVPNHFAVYAGLDETLPLSEWSRIAEKINGDVGGAEGLLLKCAPGAKGRYLRLYALKRNAGFGEIEVFGRPTGEPTPSPAHEFGDTRSFDDRRHWFSCLRPGCKAKRLHEKHAFAEEALDTLPEAGRPGAIATPCRFCGYRTRRMVKGPGGIGRIVSRGAAATVAGRKGRTAAPTVTDGDFVQPLRSGAPVSDKFDDPATGYVEIDLGESHAVSAVNVLGLAGKRLSWTAFATDDAAKPISEWTRLGDCAGDRAEDLDGSWLLCKPCAARYIRIYALGGDLDIPQAGFAFREITVYE